MRKIIRTISRLLAVIVLIGGGYGVYWLVKNTGKSTITSSNSTPVPTPAVPAGIPSGWHPYLNTEFGLQLYYPSELNTPQVSSFKKGSGDSPVATTVLDFNNQAGSTDRRVVSTLSNLADYMVSNQKTAANQLFKVYQSENIDSFTPALLPAENTSILGVASQPVYLQSLDTVFKGVAFYGFVSQSSSPNTSQIIPLTSLIFLMTDGTVINQLIVTDSGYANQVGGVTGQPSPCFNAQKYTCSIDQALQRDFESHYKIMAQTFRHD